MADDTDAGLSVRQLLKMVASGDLRAVLYVFGKPDFHIWSRLREFGAHIPDPDLESFKTRLRDILMSHPPCAFLDSGAWIDGEHGAQAEFAAGQWLHGACRALFGEGACRRSPPFAESAFIFC